jgi:hypothetical protein
MEGLILEWRKYHFQIILLRIIQGLKMSAAGILVSFWVEGIQTIFLTSENRWLVWKCAVCPVLSKLSKTKSLTNYDIKSRVLHSKLICVTIIRQTTAHYRLPPELMSWDSPEYWVVFIYCRTLFCCVGLVCPLCFVYLCPTIATAVIWDLNLVMHER